MLPPNDRARLRWPETRCACARAALPTAGGGLVEHTGMNKSRYLLAIQHRHRECNTRDSPTINAFPTLGFRHFTGTTSSLFRACNSPARRCAVAPLPG